MSKSFNIICKSQQYLNFSQCKSMTQQTMLNMKEHEISERSWRVDFVFNCICFYSQMLFCNITWHRQTFSIWQINNLTNVLLLVSKKFSHQLSFLILFLKNWPFYYNPLILSSTNAFMKPSKGLPCLLQCVFSNSSCVYIFI